MTFDDLPIYGARRPVVEARLITDRLLAGLVRHDIPAVGFVNESGLEGRDRAARIALLTEWLDAGMELGNHGYSHLSLSHTPLARYIADTARGDHVTAALVRARGGREHWFRYPFLETGASVSIRAGFQHWLKRHGYRVAPVTMENADWQFADAYDAALRRHDEHEATRVRQGYLVYTRQAIRWYRHASVALLGREIRFVFMLHASKLNADCIDGLARELQRAHLRSVPLSAALRDPAYRIPETTVDANGDEWLSRWSLSLHRPLPWDSFPAVPQGVDAGGKR